MKLKIDRRGDFVQVVACEPGERLVAVGDEAVAVEHDGLVRGLGELAHALFALAHLALGAPALGDVGDQHKGAELLPRAVKVWNQVDLDHPHLAIGQDLLAGVFHALTVRATLHVRLDGLPGLVANRFLHRQAQYGFGAVAVVGGVALVGKLAAQAGQVVVGHQRRHRVGNQAQQSVAGAAGARGGGCVGAVLHGLALVGFVIADPPDSSLGAIPHVR
ncbi:hypothetical protein QF021_003327 [Acidovorax delafieldii]|nr:hypothetical protein [Acidovorax delafieldii]